ncbi:MAG TPA: chloride channel protein [Bacteroidales bacterium]|nr:chloride channel protein [Bacteroidales bacterium]
MEHKQENGLIARFLEWRVRRIPDRQFIGMVAVVAGLAAGLAAVILKNAVHFIRMVIVDGLIASYQPYLFFLFPMIGIAIALLFIRYVVGKKVKHGIPNILYSIAQTEGKIDRHNIYSSVVTSALTVGFGGSVGLEGPTVSTGAAIGSNLGQLLRLNQKQISLLIACACAGAIASIFKAPIAAIVFAVEVIMIDLTMASIVPLLIASVSGALTSYLLLGSGYLYAFQLTETFLLHDIPFYIVLGIVAGLLSTYFTRFYIATNRLFKKINGTRNRLLIGGLLLGGLIFLIPAFYGEGYEAVNNCLRGDYSYIFDNSLFSKFQGNFSAILILLSAIVLLKVFATAITFGAGGVGGVFAPALFIGANLGVLFSFLARSFGFQLNTSNFALLAMAGMMAGVLHAPLTAIFMIAEITGGYSLFLPLMIVSTIAFITTRYSVPNSIYTYQLAERGQLLTHDKDRNMLRMLNVSDLIETNFQIIRPEMTLGELVKVIAKSERNVFPVTGPDGTYLGIIFLNDVREIIFEPEKYQTVFVKDLMFMPEERVSPDDSMEVVARIFQETAHYNLPVVRNGIYLGFVSRANVFSAYRKLLKEYSE